MVDVKLSERTDSDAISTCFPHLHSKLFTAVGAIRCFAAHPQESIFAYVDSKAAQKIKLIKWSPVLGTTAALSELKVPDEINPYSLVFSQDGRYLAALGTIPTTSIFLWDWENQKLITSAFDDQAASQISFCPDDSKILCTSGAANVITFWSLKIGFKNHTFTKIRGASLVEVVGNVKLMPKPNLHCWVKDKNVYVSSEDGNEVYGYASETGHARMIVSNHVATTHQPSNFKLFMNGANLAVVLRNKHSTVVAGLVLP